VQQNLTGTCTAVEIRWNAKKTKAEHPRMSHSVACPSCSRTEEHSCCYTNCKGDKLPRW